MSNCINQQLVHPELMTKEMLIEVLKTKCIEMPDTKSMDKEELLNIFKRIALPLPQRDYSDSKYLGKKMASLRVKNCIPIASFESNKELEKLTQQSVFNGNTHNNIAYNNKRISSKERIKPPIDNTLPMKTIRLSDKNEADVITKRKLSSSSQVNSVKQKRQKITWP